jgi:class 3 adenylate cyclase/tetratricopeptide (TPR) repeat protein
VTITCGACGSPAPEDARFCPGCGASLAAECPACGSPAGPADRFCAACGAPLARGDGERRPVSATEERRVISALFADLVGFTAHTERSDLEESRRRLTAYHSRARQDVERFGGRVEKLLGDGIFAVFGSPVAHEDDPERAVRSALRIVESTQELNEQDPNLALAVRVAVTTGEAIVQLEATPDREGVVGDVVNTASRLQGLAEPGRVVVDERTFRATQGAVDYQALEAAELKGKEGRQPVWQATGLRSRYGVAVEEEAPTPLVGRANELAVVTDAFDRAAARRSPQLVTVVGEPGVGKSRLVRELRAVIDDRPDLTWWRQGRCLPYGEGVTFWAIGEVVKAQAGILDSEPRDAAIAKLRAAAASVVDDPEEAAWMELRLRPLVGLGGPEVERSELFAAWVRFFEGLAARSPLILVVEDLHWADDAVADFLSHLLDWAQDSPILVLCTARPELFDQRPDWGGGRRDAVNIGLTALTDQETVELVAALSGRPLMDAGLQAALVERSGGNPLYVTEFVRLAEQQGWLEEGRIAGDIPLPDGVSSIIAARLDLLDPDEKSVLQAAAVVGRVFWAGAVSFIEGLDGAEVDRRLRKLVGRELIRPVRRPSMQGQTEYTFVHVLARDAAYQRLTRQDRARLHEATANWLEAVSGDRSGDVSELLAHHLATAWELAPSDDSERRRRVYRFQMAAGERAKGFDVARARSFYEAAIELAATGAEAARPKLEIARLGIGGAEDDQTLLEEALAGFIADGDLDGEAQAVVALARHEWWRGRPEQADVWYERSMLLAESLEPSPTKAEILLAGATNTSMRGDDDTALPMIEEAMKVAQSVGDTRSYARAMVVRGTSFIQMGDPAGITDLGEGLRIQLDRGDTLRAINSYNNLATTKINMGHFVEARGLIDEAIAYGSARGLASHVDWSYSTRNEALYSLGEWDECLRVADRLLAEDVQRGGSQVGTFAQAWKSTIQFFRDPGPQALERVESAMLAFQDIGDLQTVLPALALLVDAHDLVGQAERSRERAVEFHHAAVGSPSFMAYLLEQVAFPMARLGMADELAQLIESAVPLGPWPEAQVVFSRAALAELEGDGEQALALLAEVITAHESMSNKVSATRARIEAGRVAVQAGDDAEAARLLDEAAAGAEELGAGRLLGRIAQLRPATGSEAATSGRA